MSTKIYGGIRIPKSKIEDFMEWFSKTCIEQAADEAFELAGHIKDKRVRKEAKQLIKDLQLKQTLKGFLKESEAKVRVALAFSEYIEGSKRQLAVFNIDCWANFFPKGRYYYVISMFPKAHYKPDYPQWVQEYGYWNNTDEPTNVTRQQWRQREKNWEVATDHNNFHLRKLSQVIIEAKDLLNMGLYHVEKKMVENGQLDDDPRLSPSWIAVSHKTRSLLEKKG